MHFNYAAIFVAAFAYFLLGWAWYSPLLFGNTWMKLMGFKQPSKAERKKMMAQMLKPMFFNYLANVVTAFVMVWLVKVCGPAGNASGVQAGIQTAVWIWLGFILTGQLNSVLWERRPFKLYLINVGHFLVGYLLLGVILAVWQ